VRLVLALTMLPVMGCSSLLGIENPSPGPIDSGGGDGIDAPGGEHLLFAIPDFQIAQLQRARVHVLLVHADTSMVDVTQSATYTSDNTLLVAISGPGVIDSVDSQSGFATITASLDGAASATVKVTVKTTLCHPVINEFQTASSASAANEWVEVLNPCTMPVHVDGWTLNYRGPNVTTGMDSNLMVTLTGDMATGEIRLFGGPQYAGTKDGMWTNPSGILGGGSGAIGIRIAATDGGTIVDSVGYGTVMSLNPFLESTAAPTMSVDVSASRAPFDGKDDNDGRNDFKITPAPTPRAPNEP